MRLPTPTCAVNLGTLERKTFPSVNSAARHLGFVVDTVRIHFNNDTPFNGWYFCAAADIDTKTERIRYLSEKWKKEGMPVKRRADTKPKGQLVSLRIDHHTVIMVPPDKATPEYAEQYRERMSKNSYNSIKSNNP
jgi:hypothetical protein